MVEPAPRCKAEAPAGPQSGSAAATSHSQAATRAASHPEVPLLVWERGTVTWWVPVSEHLLACITGTCSNAT